MEKDSRKGVRLQPVFLKLKRMAMVIDDGNIGEVERRLTPFVFFNHAANSPSEYLFGAILPESYLNCVKRLTDGLFFRGYPSQQFLSPVRIEDPAIAHPG